MKQHLVASEFRDLKNIEYFNFEEDFIEKNIRCIPMIVRFKMDAAGIKLKLAEWSKFNTEERVQLAMMPAHSIAEISIYHQYLAGLIEKYTGHQPTVLSPDENPGWANTQTVAITVTEKAKELNVDFTKQQWQSLTNLQRFALLKLCRDGHENKNFPKAIKEFNLS